MDFQSRLHSAVASDDLEVAEILLQEKTTNDIFKYEQGVTPLDLLIKKRIEMYGSLQKLEKRLYCIRLQEEAEDFQYLDIHSNKNLDMELKPKFLTQQLEANEKFINRLITYGNLTEMLMQIFYATCTLKNCAIVRNLLEKIVDVNQPVSGNSSMWPGYTGLHFASLCTNAETIKMLIRKGANLLACDAKGVTPLDICIKLFSVREVHSFLTLVPAFRNILFSDGKTKLMNYILLLNESNDPSKYLQNEGKVRGDASSKVSPLWPGYTTLHLGVHLLPEDQYYRIHRILNSGSSVFIQDIHGSTPLHLAFRLNKMKFVNILFKYHEKSLNPLDNDNLSHLHIACAVNNENMVKRLLTIEANINIAYNGKPLIAVKPGWTPLHTACYTKNATVAKILLDADAHLLQADFKEFNEILPLPKVLTGNYNKSLLEVFVALLWANKKLQQQMEEETSLTMLHVVCYAIDHKKIKNLLNKKVDVNARIREDSSIWPGYTPLHILTFLCANNVTTEVEQAIKLLLDEEANVTVMNADGNNTPVHLILSSFNNQAKAGFNVLIKHHRDFTVNPTNKQGLSHFHIACLACSPMTVEGFLQCGVDANQVVKEFVDELAGMSPLHLVLHSTIFGVDLQLQTIDVLLAYGANVDAVDARGWTVLHHLAKYRPVLQKLLDRIVRANPNMCKETVDGETPFQILIQSGASVEELKFFMKHGSHANAYNRVNNRGYMSMVLTDEKYEGVLNDVLELFISSPDIIKIDERGRNEIFNTFWSDRIYLGEDEFVDLIEQLIRLGCDIHQQDREGKTALHVAIELCNLKAVSSLLTCGADINLVDSAGKSPFYYCVRFIRRDELAYYPMLVSLIAYLSKLQLVGLEVSPLNTRLLRQASLNEYGSWVIEDEDEDEDRQSEDEETSDVEVEYFEGEGSKDDNKNGHSEDEDRSDVEDENFEGVDSEGKDEDGKVDKITLFGEVEKTKTEKIGTRGLTLYNFVFEKDAVKIISSFTQEERDRVSVVLESIDYKTYGSLRHLLKLQYRKVTQRLSLTSPAALSLKKLLGFPLPDLCVENLFKFLTNVELKCLVSAAMDNDDSSMIADD